MVHTCTRYFGSAEGSKFVEMCSTDNVKRTWVNYGTSRDWMDPEQGQVGGVASLATVLLCCSQGEEFLYKSTEVKNVWIPMGEIFAN